MVRHWLSKQFIGLGFSPEKANDKAVELLTRGQGICVLAQVYNNKNFFSTEVNKLKKSNTSGRAGGLKM